PGSFAEWWRTRGRRERRQAVVGEGFDQYHVCGKPCGYRPSPIPARNRQLTTPRRLLEKVARDNGWKGVSVPPLPGCGRRPRKRPVPGPFARGPEGPPPPLVPPGELIAGIDLFLWANVAAGI